MNKIIMLNEKDKKLTKKSQEMIQTFKDYKEAKKQLENFKKLEEKLKEELKKYDFEKLVISNEDKIEMLVVNKFVQKRTKFDMDEFKQTLEKQFDKQQTAQIVGCYELAKKEQITECIRFDFKDK